jgi:hypothetical protein
MTNIYCDVDDLPKGYRYGTMKECALKGEIGLYGLKKIDNITKNIYLRNQKIFSVLDKFCSIFIL